MGMPRSKNLSEPDDIDVLNLYTEFSDRNISIAECLDNKGRSVSMIVTNRSTDFVQVILNKKEVELMIEAFEKLKRNME